MTFSAQSCANNKVSVDAYNHLSSAYDRLIPDPPGFISFYQKICGATPCRVLDVGCGTGRLLEVLARDGHECFGVDPSSESLEVAARRLQDAGLQCELKIDHLPELAEVIGTFDKVIVAGGAFEYLLTTHAQVTALIRLSDLLSPGGCLVFDVAVPPFVTDNPQGNYRGNFSEKLEGECSLYSSEVRLGYDHFRQLVRSVCTFNFDGCHESLQIEYMTRYTTRSEWQLLLEAARLRGQIFGNYYQGPVTRESSNLVIVAKRSEQ